MSARSIRDAKTSDASQLHEIYAHYVRTGLGTFEEAPPGVASFEDKLHVITHHGLPFIAAEANGEIVGYAYASPFRPRTGYRYSVEDSVYVRDDQRGKGVGRELLAALIRRCSATGVRQIVAVIGDSQNLASIAVHERNGFAHAGIVKDVGYKFGRWVDIVLMQLALNGGGASTPPMRGAWT